MTSPLLPPLSTLPPFLFAAALSAYGLLLCRDNITRLQQYESASEKAAEWSSTAAQRLQRTRRTQASGTLALTLSFLAATTLPFLPSQHDPTTLGVTGLALGAGTYTACTHMARFWNDGAQPRIPFVEGYNEAVRGSGRVVGVLEVLAYSWGVAGCVWALEWRGVGVGVGIWLGVVVARGWWAVVQG